ncbi:MAG: ABC transporter ATP-binding protein [Firmicutes bacterium]|jgi:ABC-2 type transport system ATP-binding protein|nr:ABC transporter ATP-binding protein [Bacillota bacterium]
MIRFEQASKRFGSTLALNNITIALPEGKIIGLFGPNGAGKSTFLKAAAGLVRLSSGEVTVNDKPPRQMRAHLAYLPEQNTLPPTWTIKRAAEFYRAFFADWDEERYHNQMDFLNLREDMKLAQISRGQLAKAQLLLTLARRARYILLDEPFSGIDIMAREEITKALIRDYSEGQQTIVISTHEIDEIENLVEYVVFIDSGQVAVFGDADELRRQEHKSIVAIMKEAFGHANH